MSPGEEDEDQFIDDVGICNIEIVFQGRDINVAIDLLFINQQVRLSTFYVPHILFHIVLSSSYCTLSQLEAHLCSLIVHEPAECWMGIEASTILLLLLLCSIAIPILRLGCLMRRRR